MVLFTNMKRGTEKNRLSEFYLGKSRKLPEAKLTTRIDVKSVGLPEPSTRILAL